MGLKREPSRTIETEFPKEELDKDFLDLLKYSKKLEKTLKRIKRKKMVEINKWNNSNRKFRVGIGRPFKKIEDEPWYEDMLKDDED